MEPTQSSRTEGSRQNASQWHPIFTTVMNPQDAHATSVSLRSSTTDLGAPILGPNPTQSQPPLISGLGLYTTEVAVGFDKLSHDHLADMNRHIARPPHQMGPALQPTRHPHHSLRPFSSLSKTDEPRGTAKEKRKENKRRHQQYRYHGPAVQTKPREPTTRTPRDGGAAIDALTTTMTTVSIGRAPERTTVRGILTGKVMRRDPETAAQRARMRARGDSWRAQEWRNDDGSSRCTPSSSRSGSAAESERVSMETAMAIDGEEEGEEEEEERVRMETAMAIDDDDEEEEGFGEERGKMDCRY